MIIVVNIHVAALLSCSCTLAYNVNASRGCLPVFTSATMTSLSSRSLLFSHQSYNSGGGGGELLIMDEHGGVAMFTGAVLADITV